MRGQNDARPGRPSVLAAGALLLLAFLLAACGQATPTNSPDADAQPTAVAQATEAPTQEPTAIPTDVPAPATDTPAAAMDTPAPATNTPAPPTSEPAPDPVPDPVAPTSEPAPDPVPPAGDEGEVELEDFQFVPRVLTVRVGTEVKFSNKDDVIHTVTSDMGLFDSGSLPKGEEFYYTFTEAGEYPYYCAPHGGPGGQGMSGTIIVVP